MRRPHHNSLGFDTLRLEGALLLPDLLEKAAQGQASLQQPEDYHVPRGFTLQEEIGRAFRIAQAQWKAYSATLERTDLDAAASARAFVEEFLRDALGYADVRATAARTVGERSFPLSLQAAPHIPVVVAPATLDLDEPDPAFAPQGGGARRKSPFQLLQEYLNAEPEARWGLAGNGRKLRLARDAATLTRPSFIEFDLETMLGQARYADFAALWRLLHASRATRTPEPVWELWRADGQREGARVREGLRIGVEAALVTLGEGFLKHPANEPLRRALIAGDLKRQAYFEELLRLVYRFIFLFAVEERGLLHPADDSPAAAAARRIYHQGYGARRLRERCLRRVARDAHDDLWQAQVIVFRALATGEPRLALPALGGLFAPAQCPYLDAASLSNRAMLEAMRHLRWSQASGTVAPVDYRNMGPEELGSVYESLLELVPDPDPHARTFAFVNASAVGDTKGNARKTTGSYYTPDSLVQELIKSALDPVIDARVAGQPDRPTEALLDITVVDPACGSGHFLLAAARRLAERLAALRAPEGAVRAQDYRHALREVITHCIYGVDRNPMALELARFALWLEGFEEGRPLGFLDHHLVCGDALIGITDVGQLAHGIPDAAFKPLSGDDKAVCRTLAKENREGLKAFAKRKLDANLPLALERDSLLAERAALEAMPDDTLAQQAAKDAAWKRYADQARASRLQQAADLFVGAFLSPKAAPQDVEHTPTSQNLYLALFTDKAPEDLPEVKQAGRLEQATQRAREARVLHWPLAFVQVFQKGGFDCVLGNPPWERIKLQEEEFFAAENGLVAQAKNKAERSQRIEWLAQGMLARHLYPELEHAPDEAAKEKETYAHFITARRIAEAVSVFAHLKSDEGGRYPLMGVGDVNTYALFAETITQVIGYGARAGFITPTGIATDESTKRYFDHVFSEGMLVSLHSFENEEFIFPGIANVVRFSLVTLRQDHSSQGAPTFSNYLRQAGQLADSRRRYQLTAEDIALFNPVSHTAPIFRSAADAALARAIYLRHGQTISDDSNLGEWQVNFLRMFDMASDSHLFRDKQWLADKQATRTEVGVMRLPSGERFLPLYEGKFIWHFDHRFGSYHGVGTQKGRGGRGLPYTQLHEYADPTFSVEPEYWVAETHVRERLNRAEWSAQWLVGFRDVTSAKLERTFVASVIPAVAVGHKLPLLLIRHDPQMVTAFLGMASSLVFDFVSRQKIGGTSMTYAIVRQLPFLAPSLFDQARLAFIVPRVLELTYTARDLQPWAVALGFRGRPFGFDLERRAHLRAEIDAYYARLYGLTREDLCYILDPASVMGDDYPSETFRVLKQNELREFGEYRTQRLVLEAWDALERDELS